MTTSISIPAAALSVAKRPKASGLALLLYRTAAVTLDLVGSRRYLWKDVVAGFPYRETWSIQSECLTEHLNVIYGCPYKPEYKNSFDEEYKYIEIALATANYAFYVPDLETYFAVIEAVGSYFDEIVKPEREPRAKTSTLWAEYTHHSATVASINGDPNSAARLNSECALVYRNLQSRLDEIAYIGCSACCRVETFGRSEERLLEATCVLMNELESELASLKVTLNHSQAPRINNLRLYNSLRACKAELHKAKPDVEVLRDRLSEARSHLPASSGVEIHTNNVVVAFYQAIAEFLEPHRTVAIVRGSYETALAGFIQSPVKDFCLLRVPNDLERDVAAFAGLPTLRSLGSASDFHRLETNSLERRLIFGAAVSVCLAIALIVTGRIWGWLDPTLLVYAWLLCTEVFSYNAYASSQGSCKNASPRLKEFVRILHSITFLFGFTAFLGVAKKLFSL